MSIRLCAFADEAAASLDGQVDALKKNGIGLIELRGVNGVNVACIPEQDAADIAVRLKKEGIGVWSIGSPVGKSAIADDFSIELKRFEHILKLAKIFDCQRIRIFSFLTTEYGKYRDEVFFRLDRMCRIAAEAGVMLCHENEKEIYGDSVGRICDILDAVPALKSILDPANYLQCGQCMDDVISRLLGRTEYFHVKDYAVTSGEHVPAGLGDGCFERIISCISKDAVLTLEPHLSSFDGFKDIDNTTLTHRIKFDSQATAFSAAANALKDILVRCGYSEQNGRWEKGAAI